MERTFKNMNKKTKKLLFVCCEVLLALAAFIMLFLPALGLKDTDTTYSGMQITFGYSAKVGALSVRYFEFSFMNFLTYIFAVAALVLAVLKLFIKDSKLITILVASLLVAAGIFFFLALPFTIVNDNIKTVIGAFGGNVKDAFTLAIGSILGGVFSILGGVVACVEFIVAKE